MFQPFEQEYMKQVKVRCSCVDLVCRSLPSHEKFKGRSQERPFVDFVASVEMARSGHGVMQQRYKHIG